MTSEVKRSCNFDSKEESILLCLIKKYNTTLENKKTDCNTNKLKLQCWKNIESQFNSESGKVFRDAITLKKKYENIKKRTKKKIADEKCYVLGTGGGPSKKPPEITDIDIEITEILGDRITGLPSEFGGDAEIITIINETADTSLDDLTIMPDVSTSTCENILDEQQQNDSKNENTKPQSSWSKNNVQSLRTPVSKPLTNEASCSKRKRNEYDTMCSKVSQWAASKANVEAEKLRIMEDEYNKKMKLIEENFEKEYILKKNESEAKIKKIEREMEATVDGIIEQNRLKKEILMLEKHLLLQKIKKLGEE